MNLSSLSHTKWDCKYHIVFILKCRKKNIFGAIRSDLGRVSREFARQKECEIVEGHSMPDHVHSYADINTTEICSFSSCWVHKRHKCDLHSKIIFRLQEKHYRPTFLGTRLFPFRSWKRRRYKH